MYTIEGIKINKYKLLDADTYKSAMCILIYLESIGVRRIIRCVNCSKVYYKVTTAKNSLCYLVLVIL